MANTSKKFDFDLFKQGKVFIAGPCSAETEEQLHETITELAKECPQVKLIRAGIWKPRTRPNSFEGVGAIALSWLKEAAQLVDLPVAIEVANAKHVEKALEAEIDVLWIGARSTVSPFIVQEIAEALRGVDIPVFVKNPVNPELALWLGAIERLEQVGLKDIAAVHRGFSAYSKSIYRNVPNWEIPIELRRQAPNLPIICDPSHIAGKRNLLFDVAQQAMNLQFDGLMIESHRKPDEAWSDAEQQLTPLALKELLQKLNTEQKAVAKSEDYNELKEFRTEIDRLDNYILELLSERMSIAREIGKYKKANDIALHQAQRWADTVRRALEIGKNNGLSENFILELFQKIHKESLDKQSED